MQHNIYIYIAVMAVVTYLIRVLPLTLIRKKITNVTLRSFLYYVPYVTLAIMTFPAIINVTNSIWSGIAALVIGVLLAYFGISLFGVAVCSCAAVFIIELLIVYHESPTICRFTAAFLSRALFLLASFPQTTAKTL